LRAGVWIGAVSSAALVEIFIVPFGMGKGVRVLRQETVP
jgi:hypothetical protein